MPQHIISVTSSPPAMSAERLDMEVDDVTCQQIYRSVARILDASGGCGRHAVGMSADPVRELLRVPELRVQLQRPAIVRKSVASAGSAVVPSLPCSSGDGAGVGSVPTLCRQHCGVVPKCHWLSHGLRWQHDRGDVGWMKSAAFVAHHEGGGVRPSFGITKIDFPSLTLSQDDRRCCRTAPRSSSCA